MSPEVATAILDAYPQKKLTGATSRSIILEWMVAKGWEQDRWGNFHPAPGQRIKLTKQRIQRQKKYSDGRWANVRSTPLIEAAQNLVAKAAEVLGDEATRAKVTGAQKGRQEAQEQRAEKSRAAERKAQVEAMAAKVVSMEEPLGFLSMYEKKGEPPRGFKARYLELTQQIDALQRMGRMPTDQDFFRAAHPPLAPVLIPTQASWVEDVDGVPYTVTLRHGESERMIIEIGSIGSMGLTNRIDPISKTAIIDFEDREGDSYASGYLQRRSGRPPTALLFFIQSQNKQRGGGGRVLDLWCELMDSFGVDAWLAEAVGDEGMAFLEKKVAQGRLENLGQRGKNLVMRCAGGYRGRQQRLPLVPNTADVLAFPERPERVEVAGRSYALSDVGVPFIQGALGEDEDEGDGPRVIDMGGNRWRYIWLHEPGTDDVHMYRYSDGDPKLMGSVSDFPQTIAQLRRRGQLNTVTAEEAEAFDGAMHQRYEETIASLQESWDRDKSEEQRRVDALVAAFFEERVRPAMERAWAEIEQGVYPFDFDYNERIAQYASREEQALSQATYGAMQRAGFVDQPGSALERYVLAGLGYRDWDQVQDMQALQWALTDFQDRVIYPLAKRRS